MRRPGSIFPAVLFAAIVTTVCPSGQAHAGVCGDVTGDDQVLAGDALNVLRKSVGLPLQLNCPLEADFKICEGDLHAWQPVHCPCFTGPTGLNRTMVENVTGIATPLYVGECTTVDGLQTLSYGLQSSHPQPGVGGDGKCHVEIETIVSHIDTPYGCSITQTIDESDIDCDTFSVMPPVSFATTQDVAVACRHIADQAVTINSTCSH